MGDEGPGGEGVGSDDSCAGEDFEETSGERLGERGKGERFRTRPRSPILIATHEAVVVGSDPSQRHSYVYKIEGRVIEVPKVEVTHGRRENLKRASVRARRDEDRDVEEHGRVDPFVRVRSHGVVGNLEGVVPKGLQKKKVRNDSARGRKV